MTSHQLDDGIVPLKQHCETHGINVSRARRACRDDTFVGAKFVQWAKLWVVDTSVDGVTTSLPEPKRGGFASNRTDGRQRFVLYALMDETSAIAAAFPDVDIVNPRIAAKQRRVARKNAAAADANTDADADALFAAENAAERAAEHAAGIA